MINLQIQKVYIVGGVLCQLSVPRSTLGFAADEEIHFNFKLSDNMQADGDIMDFYQNGDVVAAFFGHDHTNSFYGKTDEGIILGYNASFGWKAYGMGGATRQVKMIVVDEDDPTNPEIYSRSYTDLTGENGGIGPIDFISPWIYNVIINNTIGKIVALISKIF